MKSVLIIGLGKFGHHLCEEMLRLGNEIMIVDDNQEVMEDLLGKVTSAKIGDCTKEDVLKSLGVRNFDICFVCIGTNFQSSLEITSMLKELGAKEIYLWVTHCENTILEGELLTSGLIEKVYTTNSIFTKEHEKIEVLSL